MRVGRGERRRKFVNTLTFLHCLLKLLCRELQLLCVYIIAVRKTSQFMLYAKINYNKHNFLIQSFLCPLALSHCHSLSISFHPFWKNNETFKHKNLYLWEILNCRHKFLLCTFLFPLLTFLFTSFC